MSNDEHPEIIAIGADDSDEVIDEIRHGDLADAEETLARELAARAFAEGQFSVDMLELDIIPDDRLGWVAVDESLIRTLANEYLRELRQHG